MGKIRTEIIKFDNFECKVIICDDNKASLTYYIIKHPNRRIFNGKKFYAFFGGVDYSKYANTYEMVNYFLQYDDSAVKYFI